LVPLVNSWIAEVASSSAPACDRCDWPDYRGHQDFDRAGVDRAVASATPAMALLTSWRIASKSRCSWHIRAAERAADA
jgi:hypothetical protein